MLAVEDNETNQIAILALLEQAGVMADCASDGPSAIEAVRKNKYDLILMDIHMPRMDGIETSRQIRTLTSREAVRPPPIIALTADVMAGDRERFIAAGMNDYIPKPINYSNLIEVLSSWIPPSPHLS
ncbi:MAG: response regulator [Oligoflexales bacterium]|nr:response regulator [Oligoflexales bacterium]